jgi:HEAT repeat protein
MRTVVILTLAGLVCGCGDGQPPRAGGKPAAHWAEVLKGPDVRARKTAARKLGNIGPADATALPALLGALKDRNPGVRCEVILALVKFGTAAREALPALAEARARDPSAEVRACAARALDRLRAGE